MSNLARDQGVGDTSCNATICSRLKDRWSLESAPFLNLTHTRPLFEQLAKRGTRLITRTSLQHVQCVSVTAIRTQNVLLGRSYAHTPLASPVALWHKHPYVRFIVNWELMSC